MADLLALLKDPNYVNANDATKRAIFNKYSVQDSNFTSANDATKTAIRQKFGVAMALPTAAPGQQQAINAAQATVDTHVLPYRPPQSSLTFEQQRAIQADRPPQRTLGQQQAIAAASRYPGQLARSQVKAATHVPSEAENPSPANIGGIVRPIIQTVGGIGGGILGSVGGPPGAVGGSALGYAIANGLLRSYDDFAGNTPPRSGLEAVGNTAQDLTTGAMYELGGQAAAAGVGALIRGGRSGVNYLANRYGNTAAQTPGQIRDAANNLWKKVTASTDTYVLSPIRARLDDIRARYNYDPASHPKMTAVLARIEQAAASGDNVGLPELRTIRGLLQDVGTVPTLKAHDPTVPAVGATLDEKGMAQSAMRSIDDLIRSQPGTGAELWSDARALESQLFRSRDVRNIVQTAKQSSRATSAEIRSQFRDIADSPQIRSYAPEEQAMIRRIAEGGNVTAALEFIGRVAPKSVGMAKLASLLGLSGAGSFVGGTTGALLGLGLYGTGVAARGGANRLSIASANALERRIRGEVAPSVFQMPAAATRLGVPFNTMLDSYDAE